MSVKIMGQVWELSLKPAEKYVLLAYADHADHEGKNIRPSQALIAWKTGYTLRQIRNITQRLEELKLLNPISKEPGKVTRYETNLENASKLSPRKVGKVFTGEKFSLVKNETQKQGGTGEIAKHKRRTEPSYREPSNSKVSKNWTAEQTALVTEFSQLVDSIVPIVNETKSKQDETRRACDMLLLVGVTPELLRQFYKAEYDGKYTPSTLMEVTRKIGAWLAKRTPPPAAANGTSSSNEMQKLTEQRYRELGLSK
jgi:transposase